jgi:hypothetical protein
MSAQIGVLAAIDAAIEGIQGEDYACPDLEDAYGAVVDLIEAVEAYAKAEAALANREIEGMNAESLDRLQPRVHAARLDLENALARVKGA